MSAFLGPIHFWLYRKVELQEQLTKKLLEAFPEQRDELTVKLDEAYGALPVGRLEDLIDETNIHGWLQQQVTRAERRLAYTAAQLAADESSKAKMLTAASEAGCDAKITAEKPEEAYQILQNVLLDGMPCDRVNELHRSDANSVCWERVNDLHSGYYTAIMADPELFDEVRDAWVGGMLKDSGMTYNRNGMVFSLTGKAC